MARHENYEYLPLPSASAKKWKAAKAPVEGTAFYLFLPLLVLFPASGFYFGRYFTISNESCCIYETSWSNELTDLRRSPTKFNGSFDFQNRYRGAPGAELDQEWDRFTHHPLIDGTASLISVNTEDIQRANKLGISDWFNSTVQYGDVNGGGYMATLEMFHQLHCLNMLRKAIHSDYYEQFRPAHNGSRTKKMRTHLDHCVEILRQVISCKGDTGLITFHWVKGNDVPYPDFNTWHSCRDPEEILKWARNREAPIKVKVEKALFDNITEMPKPP